MVVSLLIITIAMGLLAYSLIAKMLSWLTMAVVVLLCTQGVRGMLVNLGIRQDSQSRTVLSSRETQLIAAGYMLSALLSVTSWLQGEGWLGLIAALVLIFSTGVWFFVSKRLKSAE